MKLRYLIYASAALLMLSGCDTRKEQVYYESDPDAVKITAEISCPHVKSNPLAAGAELRSFSFNDVICVQTPDLSAEFYRSSKGWNPTDRYYFRWDKDPVTFQAYYPVNKSTAYDKFTIRQNQYSYENLVACDYMTGEAVDQYRQEVKIKLHRQMAKVRIRLAGVEEGQKVQAFKIGSYTLLADGKVDGSSMISPYVESASIPTGENGSIYTAIVLPGPASSKMTLVSATYKGSSLSVKGMPAFEPGFAYDYTLVINGTSMVLSEPEVTCWSEALPAGELPDQEEGEQPGEGDQPGDEPEDPKPTVDPKARFVTPEGAGDKTGLSWDNAMGLDELRPLLGSDYGAKSADDCAALDGLTFHFMEGAYCMTSAEKDRMKLLFQNYNKVCRITFLGGYDSSSTGTDLTKRDIKANETKFTGDRNGNGKADEGDTGIFCLDAYAYITFDGCSFAHSYGRDTWKQKAFMVNTDVAGATVRVNLSNCKFYDNHDKADADAKYQGGSAVYLAKNSIAAIHNCQFISSASKSRGGALRAMDSTSVLFLNNCSLYENSITGEWGNAVQMTDGSLLMNNCTVAKNVGQGGALNGMGNWVIVNSTIINAHVVNNDARNMTIRCESKADHSAFLMNSIVLFDGDKPGIYVNGEDRQLASKGNNLYNSVAGNGVFATHSADKSGVSVSGLGLTWNAAGYYTWNGSVSGFTKAKLADIESAVKTGCNKAVGPFANIGLEFYNWLQSLESGKNPLAYDQAGNARDAAAMWPGAYEKH